METTPAPTVLDRIRAMIAEYVVLPDPCYADILSLYVLHSHTFVMEESDDDEDKTRILSRKSPRTTPYIYITSKGPGSGKTRLMEVLIPICKGARKFDGGTGPTFFRLIEARRPTLFLDEVDTIYSGNKDEALRQVLNSGYKSNGVIPRTDPSSADGIRDYATFCPKVLGGIDNGYVPTTVTDRAITIQMVKTEGQVAPFYEEDVEDQAADILDEIATWMAANFGTLHARENRPDRINGITDRQNDIVRPLLTIADRFGEAWAKRARVAVVAAFRYQSSPLDPPALALSKVRDYMTANDLDRISSAKVVELVGQSAHQIGAWFDAFGLQPQTLRGFDKRTAGRVDGQSDKVKGYALNATMTEAWNRFLPALPEQIS